MALPRGTTAVAIEDAGWVGRNSPAVRQKYGQSLHAITVSLYGKVQSSLLRQISLSEFREFVRLCGFRQLDLTTKATCDGRKLETLDLAFFGRLLVCMNKVKAIPGFQPPPFEFPDDLKYTRMSSD